jgi:hypothetical protein
MAWEGGHRPLLQFPAISIANSSQAALPVRAFRKWNSGKIGNRISRSETVARKSWPEDQIQGRLWASIDGFFDSYSMGN